VGEQGKDSRLAFPSREAAVGKFEWVFKDKTGNLWKNRHSFVSVPGRYHLMEPVNDVFKGPAQVVAPTPSGTKARSFWNQQKQSGVWHPARSSLELESALGEFRKLATESGQDEDIWEEAAQTVIDLLKDPRGLSGPAMFEGMWILTNIAAGEAPRCQVLIGQGALEAVQAVSARNFAQASLQACWLVGNLAAESLGTRTDCLGKGMHLLMPGWRRLAKAPFDREMWHHSLSQLLMSKPKLEFSALQPLWPPVLADWRTFPAERGKIVPCLDALTELNPLWLEEVTSPDDIASLRALAQAGKNHALLVLGQFCSGDERQTDIAINDANIIPLLQELMDVSLQKDHLWILSNIAAGTQRQAELLAFLPQIWLPPTRVAKLAHNLRLEWCWVMVNLSVYLLPGRFQPFQLVFQTVIDDPNCPPLLARHLKTLMSQLKG
jgi:hypothetical protein